MWSLLFIIFLHVRYTHQYGTFIFNAWHHLSLLHRQSREIPQGLHPSPNGEWIMGTQIWGNFHQVEGRLRNHHIPGCQHILGKLGFKEGKQAPLFQESLRAGVEPTAAFPIHRWTWWWKNWRRQGGVQSSHVLLGNGSSVSSHRETSAHVTEATLSCREVMQQGPAVSPPRQGLPGLFSCHRCHRKLHWSLQMEQLWVSGRLSGWGGRDPSLLNTLSPVGINKGPD